MTGKTILLVEDEAKVQKYNKHLFEEEGFIVLSAMSLAQAQTLLKSDNHPDIIVLDRGLPDGDGLSLLQELREAGNKTPVLLLTGYGKDSEIELGFDTGCDDYLPKPYAFGVLHKRIIRLLKSVEAIPDIITKDRITLKIPSMTVLVDGIDLQLTQKEFALLQYFMQHENQILSSEHIYQQVWGQSMAGDSGAVQTHLSRLRKKLSASGYTITFSRGDGYCFERE